MDRRTLIKTGSLAVLGLGFGGCATTRTARTVTPRPNAGRLAVNLPLVEASWDRVIRTTVGLRPHRDSGFVLKPEKLDAKTIIHNYGHGGAGMSISWGTGYMAAEFAMEQSDRRAAVIGCGAVGLTAARQLQRRGFDVTIYAMSVPPDTTSNMSLAGFTPTSGLVENDRRTPEWDAQFRRAAEIAYRQLQLLAGPDYGISWIHSYNPTEELREPGGGAGNLLPSQLRTGQVVLQQGEHPFPTKYAIRRSTMRIEPSIYLDALVRDFLLFGGHIVIRKFDTPRDLMSLSESVIINCTGLGSLALFGDEELVPLKGQLTHLIPQSEIN
ncbi:MAG: FAD-dependent oxidoreductase, partial [Phycisphaerales bacterium]|nr:FAD-dependent oxidoreductase [Phycisphaerales bacterium]